MALPSSNPSMESKIPHETHEHAKLCWTISIRTPHIVVCVLIWVAVAVNSGYDLSQVPAQLMSSGISNATSCAIAPLLPTSISAVSAPTESPCLCGVDTTSNPTAPATSTRFPGTARTSREIPFVAMRMMDVSASPLDVPVDTGASMNVIVRRALRDLGLEHLAQPLDRNFVSQYGHFNNEVYLDVWIGDVVQSDGNAAVCQMLTRFLVQEEETPGLKVGIKMGAEFLHQQQVDITYGTREMVFPRSCGGSRVGWSDRGN